MCINLYIFPVHFTGKNYGCEYSDIMYHNNIQCICIGIPVF